MVIDYTREAAAVASALPHGVVFDDFIRIQSDDPVSFAQMPFDHPLYILYSSGTTGIPNASCTGLAASCSSISEKTAP